ncbi:desulfoferrodoxin, partial [bacterium]|nr:desulfoferrodoxin [bacterium]
MTQTNGIYKCELCGNIVEVLVAGGADLICCGQEMALLNENTTDAAQEKHVPVIKKDGTKVTVTVGSVLHPMQEKHYIQFIELFADGKVLRKQLNPGDEPVAVFETAATELSAREYCNLHGLW